MWELLPETWHVETESSSCCHSKRPRRNLVIDITVWTECYATMAAILSAAYPTKAPQFFAYLRIISKASRTFERSAWASYDMAFRRQVANSGSLDWGVVDAALYSEAFAGRAKQIPRCRYCLADTHPSPECVHAPEDPPQPGVQPRNPARSSPRPLSAELCRLFNSPGGSRCRFPYCRYSHLCARCRRPHPAAECSEGKRQSPGDQGPSVPSSGAGAPPPSSRS